MNAMNLARTLAFLSLASMAAVSLVGRARAAGDQLVDHVRTANERFQDVRAAVAEDYVPVGCFGNVDGAAMGVRYVCNGTSTGSTQRDLPRAVTGQMSTSVSPFTTW